MSLRLLWRSRPVLLLLLCSTLYTVILSAHQPLRFALLHCDSLSPLLARIALCLSRFCFPLSLLCFAFAVPYVLITLLLRFPTLSSLYCLVYLVVLLSFGRLPISSQSLAAFRFLPSLCFPVLLPSIASRVLLPTLHAFLNRGFFAMPIWGLFITIPLLLRRNSSQCCSNSIFSQYCFSVCRGTSGVELAGSWVSLKYPPIILIKKKIYTGGYFGGYRYPFATYKCCFTRFLPILHDFQIKISGPTTACWVLTSLTCSCLLAFSCTSAHWAIRTLLAEDVPKIWRRQSAYPVFVSTLLFPCCVPRFARCVLRFSRSARLACHTRFSAQYPTCEASE